MHDDFQIHYAPKFYYWRAAIALLMAAVYLGVYYLGMPLLVVEFRSEWINFLVCYLVSWTINLKIANAFWRQTGWWWGLGQDRFGMAIWISVSTLLGLLAILIVGS